MPRTIEELRSHSFPGEIWQHYMNQVHENYAALGFLPYAPLSDEYVEEQEEQQLLEEQRQQELEQLWNGDADRQEIAPDEGQVPL